MRGRSSDVVNDTAGARHCRDSRQSVGWKALLAANLSYRLAQAGQIVLIIDADFGRANVDIMLNLSPSGTLHDVIVGQKSLGDGIISGPGGIHLQRVVDQFLQQQPAAIRFGYPCWLRSRRTRVPATPSAPRSFSPRPRQSRSLLAPSRRQPRAFTKRFSPRRTRVASQRYPRAPVTP